MNTIIEINEKEYINLFMFEHIDNIIQTKIIQSKYYKIIPGKTIRELRTTSRISNKEVRRIIIALIKIIYNIHNIGYTHMNITPDSVYIDKKGQIYLGGFNFISYSKGTLIKNKLCNKLCNKLPPPEYHNPKIHICSQTIDMWQIGIVLFFMLTGTNPTYKKIRDYNNFKNNTSKSIDFLWHLSTQLLTFDAKNRIQSNIIANLF
jgi:serine/threonine protein kinase